MESKQEREEGWRENKSEKRMPLKMCWRDKNLKEKNLQIYIIV